METWDVGRLAHAPAAFTWREARADARALGTNRNPLRLLMGAVRIADALVVLALSLVAFVLRHGVEPIPLEVLLAAALGSVLTVNALSLSGAYSGRGADGFTAQVLRAIQAWSVVFVLLVLAGYLAKTVTEYSRAWATLWYVSVVLGLAAVRAVSSAQLRRWHGRGRLASTVAIVDLCGRGEGFARRLMRGDVAGARLLGVFTDGAAGRRPGASTVSDLVELSKLFRVDEVLVFVSGDTAADLGPLLRSLGTIPTNVRLCPALPELAYAPARDAGLVHGVPALTVHRRPLDDWSGVVKRCEDLVVGGVATVLLAPLMLLVAALVKLDSPGPALFRQARQGFNNNVIMVLKFRTMVHRPEPERDVPQAKRDDARITRVGRVLRRTSLDELPQLLNVLRGEMSLVGPRPHAVAHNHLYAGLIDDYLGRHRVQPGITGWAQVNGLRGETDTLDKMQRRVEYDLAYIDRWSVFLDLKILLLTAISVVFDRERAY